MKELCDNLGFIGLLGFVEFVEFVEFIGFVGLAGFVGFIGNDWVERQSLVALSNPVTERSRSDRKIQIEIKIEIEG